MNNPQKQALIKKAREQALELKISCTSIIGSINSILYEFSEITKDELIYEIDLALDYIEQVKALVENISAQETAIVYMAEKLKKLEDENRYYFKILIDSLFSTSDELKFAGYMMHELNELGYLSEKGNDLLNALSPNPENEEFHKLVKQLDIASYMSDKIKYGEV